MRNDDSMSIEQWADAYIEAYGLQDVLTPDSPLWWVFERSLLPLRPEAAEEIWTFVLAVLVRSPPQKVLGTLAAGPLEDLIAYEGDRFIERIEQHARHDPAFRHLLGGVWQNQASPEIWERVEVARGIPW
ncbi:hypothetical protein JI752_013800 [Lysobacter sp. MMG2]|uniref:DUF6869 domain-containing protein n=1 Tax=Lysobacter sp. MMG2 TaxID=2801338 RepID=UPI001C24FAAF|nr:hypothetical protein [Lysobacter sp. MMG2]MBU8977222.1 hypothetical protein [Lysobacter sp. MMG2]